MQAQLVLPTTGDSGAIKRNAQRDLNTKGERSGKGLDENDDLDSTDYQALAEFRYQLRSFLAFSEQAARAVGLEPQHHQLLLALKGLSGQGKVTIGKLAERLKIQHHSTVELVNRMSERHLIRR